ncbi:MAG TPA: hypothetical protein DEG79_18420, partial [Hyphomonas sp.]|nr:hypothetical protein [Hyphomonas sp.]
ASDAGGHGITIGPIQRIIAETGILYWGHKGVKNETREDLEARDHGECCRADTRCVFGHDDFLTRSIRNAGEPTAATASA